MSHGEAIAPREMRRDGWSVEDDVPVHGRTRHALKIVAIGGGTGLPALLTGLSRLSGRGALPHLDVTAIVAMGDDGGSSGRLRREQGVLPPGDIRNCLVALADKRHRRLARLFQYRFGRGRGLQGHAMGNLLLTALTSMEGDFLTAVRRAQRMLACRGKVLPATLEPVQLLGVLADGRTIQGEHRFKGAQAISRVELVPRNPRPAPGVLSAIRDADVVLLGPGSLFSSVIANLLVGGVAEALAESRAVRMLIQNLMTQPGETSGMDAAEHVRAIQRHAGNVVDVLLVDPLETLEPETRERYAGLGQLPVSYDRRSIAALGVLPLEAELLAEGSRVRHDPEKAAAAVLGWMLQASEV